MVLDYQIRRGLDEAELCLDEEDFAGARRILTELRRQAPGNPEVLGRLAEVYFELDQWTAYVEVMERLRERTPDRAELYPPLALAYVRAGLPFRAAALLERFCVRFPKHGQVSVAREDLARVRRLCGDLLAEIRERDGFPLSDAEAERALREHEWMQILIPAGRFDEALELGRAIEKEAPEWPPLCNNLGLVLGMLGQHEAALSYLDRSLAAQPDNPFALAERVRRLYLLGHAEEAAQAALEAATAAASSARDDAETKLAEAFALLGDDEKILSAHRDAEAKNRPQHAWSRAFLLALAGTAELRRGDEEAARALWKRAQEAQPGFDLAETYMEDLDRPVGERHIPWYLEAGSIIPQGAIDEYLSETRRLKNADALRARTRRFLDERPVLKASLPALLDRGDPRGRIFALTLCRLAETPELWDMLRNFALGQRGPDELRHRAMIAVKAAGLLPKGPVRMGMKGEWSDVVPIVFEVTEEPLREHPPSMYPLIERIHAALHSDDLEDAEGALSAALLEEPDAPELLNNLAVLRSRQGRTQEAKAITKDLRERFPDYSFARMNEANQELQRGRPKEALKLLSPLLQRERLHVSEFTTLCSIEVRALVALGEVAQARSWFEMLREHLPGHVLVPALRDLLGQAEVLGREFRV